MLVTEKETNVQETMQADNQEPKLVITPNGQGVEILIYDLLPEKEQDFFGTPDVDGQLPNTDGFYRQVIIPWLKFWQVPRADAWVVRRFDDQQILVGLQLIIVSSLSPPPWDPIEGIGEFLKGTLTIHPRSDLNHKHP